MKKYLSLVMVLALTLGLVGCSSSDKPSAQKSDGGIKVGLLTGVAGLGDKSFNDLAYEGAKKAEEELNIELKVVEPADLASTENQLRELAKAKCDLVIGVGFDMVEPLEIVASEYPDTKFAIVDVAASKPADNIESLVFEEHEGSFLVGALAALVTETNKLGVIPAMDVPFLNRFVAAFEEGAKYVNSDIDVAIQPVASDFNGFNDAGKAKNIAQSMYKNGVDIVYPVAGGAGVGVFEAAKEANKYALGINSDQDYMAEGLILTSMLKKVDVAVYNTIKSVVEDNFKAGVSVYGLDNNGIGITEMKFTKDVIGEENLKQLEEIKGKIIDGSIKVTDITK